MNSIDKHFVERAVKVKIRRMRLTNLWFRATGRKCSDSIYRALLWADMENENCNMLCGPRYALLACRIAERMRWKGARA